MRFTEKLWLAGHFCLSLFLLSVFILEPLVAAGDAGSNPKSVLSNDRRIKQVLARLTFGARPGDFERVKKIGVKAYIEQQLNPETISDAALDKQLEKLPTLSLSTPTIVEQYNPPKPVPTPTQTTKPTGNNSAVAITTATKPNPPAPKNPQQVVIELQRAKLLRAVYSERQLNEVLVDFWENHFSIYSQKDADRWLLTGFDREAIRPFAMGRFRDLLGATAHSPAMLFYLDNWHSSVLRKYPATKDKPARQIGGINENYARELMELHTLGVGGGYTQKDVQEVARCFTGWTIRKPNEEGVFVFNPAAHDNGEKTVLGQKIPADGGIADGERVLDILARHPSTAHFIATKLARRFLGDNPPAAVVNQAAQVFLQTDGSIRRTLQSILTSSAFFSPTVYQAKIKSPFEFVAASLRITSAETDANRPVLDWISKMGQPIFGHLTPEGYPEQSREWLANGSLLVRFNFASALAAGKIKGTRINTAQLLENVDLNNPTEISAFLSRLILQNEITFRSKEELAKIADEAALKSKISNTQSAVLSLGNQMPNVSTATSNPSQSPAKPIISATAKLPDYVAELITLMLGMPEFQRK